MNKPVAPLTGTKGLHKEEKAKEIAKSHSKISEKSLKKGARKVAVRITEAKKKIGK